MKNNEHIKNVDDLQKLLLKDYGYYTDEMILIRSCKCNCVDGIKYIFEKKPNINTIHTISVCSKYNSFDVLKYLIENNVEIKNINNTIECAVDGNNLEILKFILSLNIKYEKNSQPLILAIKNNNFEIFKFLHLNGYNIHKNNEFLLNSAVNNSYQEIANYIITDGIENKNDLDLILGNSIYQNLTDISLKLLNLGANIHFENDYSLEAAVFRKNYKLAEYLVELGCDIKKIENEKRYKEFLIYLRKEKLKKYV